MPNRRKRRNRQARSTSRPRPRRGSIHPRDLLAHLKLSPRQSMGQNFLVRGETARDIVAGAGIEAGQHVLEVGPGLGALTWALRQAGAEVVAVEKDRGLAAFLAEQYRDDPGVQVVQADILEWDLQGLTELADDWLVVANLPYNVALPILFRLLDSPLRPRALHLMVQREVGERMLARAGTSAYGVLTLRLGLLATVTPLVHVPPEAFYPSPKVHSMVVKVVPRSTPPCDTGPLDALHRLVKAAFASRRKTLRNALTAASFPGDTVDRALATAGIDGNRRGETLTLEEYCRLNRALARAG